MLLPEGAGANLATAAALWNAAEAAERRKDAQLAREIVLALRGERRAHDGGSDRARAALCHRKLRVEGSRGSARRARAACGRLGERARQLACASPDHDAAVEGEGFAAKKARDLEPEIKRIGGRAVVSEGEAWGRGLARPANRYFAEQGLEIRVDVKARSRAHIGPIRMRAADAEANARADEVARANAKAARDPDQVLATLTRNNATFSKRDLERHLHKHIGDLVGQEAVREVLGHSEVLPLHDRETGEAVGRFTTKTVRAQERQALADAAEVAAAVTGRVSARAKAEALESRALRADQLAAFKHAAGEGGLQDRRGRAGTGRASRSPRSARRMSGAGMR